MLAALLQCWVGLGLFSPPTDIEPGPVSVYGGEPTGEGEWDGTVAVRVGNVRCSGVVVAPRLVLTAAHCVSSDTQAEDITVMFGPDVLPPDATASVQRFGAHPDFCGTECSTDIRDMAYLVLDSQVNVPIILPLQSQAEHDATMRTGTDVTIVGYGETDAATTDIKHAVTTEISKFSHTGAEIHAGGGGKDSCQGDSGGPLFTRTPDGDWRLVGLTSQGSPTCGEGGIYVSPLPMLCWLREETGVDLSADGCCDCIDTQRIPDDPGCGCSAEPGPAPHAVILSVFALGLWRRRRAGR